MELQEKSPDSFLDPQPQFMAHCGVYGTDSTIPVTIRQKLEKEIQIYRRVICCFHAIMISLEVFGILFFGFAIINCHGDRCSANSIYTLGPGVIILILMFAILFHRYAIKACSSTKSSTMGCLFWTYLVFLCLSVFVKSFIMCGIFLFLSCTAYKLRKLFAELE